MTVLNQADVNQYSERAARTAISADLPNRLLQCQQRFTALNHRFDRNVAVEIRLMTKDTSKKVGNILDITRDVSKATSEVLNAARDAFNHNTTKGNGYASLQS